MVRLKLVGKNQRKVHGGHGSPQRCTRSRGEPESHVGCFGGYNVQESKTSDIPS